MLEAPLQGVRKFVLERHFARLGLRVTSMRIRWIHDRIDDFSLARLAAVPIAAFIRVQIACLMSVLLWRRLVVSCNCIKLGSSNHDGLDRGDHRWRTGYRGL